MNILYINSRVLLVKLLTLLFFFAISNIIFCQNKFENCLYDLLAQPKIVNIIKPRQLYFPSFPQENNASSTSNNLVSCFSILKDSGLLDEAYCFLNQSIKINQFYNYDSSYLELLLIEASFNLVQLNQPENAKYIAEKALSIASTINGNPLLMDGFKKIISIAIDELGLSKYNNFADSVKYLSGDFIYITDRMINLSEFQDAEILIRNYLKRREKINIEDSLVCNALLLEIWFQSGNHNLSEIEFLYNSISNNYYKIVNPQILAKLYSVMGFYLMVHNNLNKAISFIDSAYNYYSNDSLKNINSINIYLVIKSIMLLKDNRYEETYKILANKVNYDILPTNFKISYHQTLCQYYYLTNEYKLAFSELNKSQNIYLRNRSINTFAVQDKNYYLASRLYHNIGDFQQCIYNLKQKILNKNIYHVSSLSEEYIQLAQIYDELDNYDSLKHYLNLFKESHGSVLIKDWQVKRLQIKLLFHVKEFDKIIMEFGHYIQAIDSSNEQVDLSNIIEIQLLFSKSLIYMHDYHRAYDLLKDIELKALENTFKISNLILSEINSCLLTVCFNMNDKSEFKKYCSLFKHYLYFESPSALSYTLFIYENCKDINLIDHELISQFIVLGINTILNSAQRSIDFSSIPISYSQIDEFNYFTIPLLLHNEITIDSELINKYQYYLLNKFGSSNVSVRNINLLQNVLHRINLLYSIDAEMKSNMQSKAVRLFTGNERKGSNLLTYSEELIADEIVVKIIRTRNSINNEILYFAILVDPKDGIKFVSLNPFKELNIIRTYQDYLENQVKRRSNLYEILWKEIDQFIDIKFKVVYVIPDGVFNLFNINTFYDGKKYLIDKYRLQYLYSYSGIYEQSFPIENHGVKLFGNPLFSDAKNNMQFSAQKYLKRDAGENQWISLPNTKNEILNIQKAYEEVESVDIYLDEEASESNLRKIEIPRILHIATHGFTNFSSDKFEECGLVLARANTVSREIENDGYLYSSDISKLNLSNTELVVLSACETGLGLTTDYHGIKSISNSFIEAGAKNVVFSTSKVNDARTKELMDVFYNFYKTSQNASDALYKAMRFQKNKYSNPGDWGSFNVISVYK